MRTSTDGGGKHNTAGRNAFDIAATGVYK